MLLDASGQIDDLWPRVAPGDPIPATGYALVPHDRLGEGLAMAGVHLGIAVPNTLDLGAVTPHLGRLGMIAVEFPSFADGRGFSIARRLRDRGFAGRLRAWGPVVSDQFGYLLACGYDEIHVAEPVASRQTAEQWLAQLGRITLAYQQGRTGRTPLSALRQRTAR